VASLADPLNGRSPRHITLPCSDLALPLQRERNRSQQAMIAWQQRAGPAEHSQGRKPAEPVARSASLDGAPLVRQRPPMRSWPDVPPSSATRRNAANDGARNVDFECFLGSSGTRPLHTVPLQCHPKPCADKHLRPSTARSDTVAFILPSIPDLSRRSQSRLECPVWRIADERADMAISTRMTRTPVHDRARASDSAMGA